MSTTPIVAAILAALADGPMATDALIESTGFERPAIVQTLAQLKHEKRIHSGRGGWYAGETDPREPRVTVHEAAPPAPAERVAKPRSSPRGKGPRKAKKNDTPKPARAARRRPGPAPRREVSVNVPLVKGAEYVFGITERGELTFTDWKDHQRRGTLNALDTARLAQCLERWAPMLQPISELREIP